MKTMNKILLILTSTALALTVRAEHDDKNIPTRHNEATIAQLQAEMASGKLTSEDLTKEYIARIIALDQNSEGVNSIIELNPDALDMARKRGQAAQARSRPWPAPWHPGVAQGQHRHRR